MVLAKEGSSALISIASTSAFAIVIAFLIAGKKCSDFIVEKGARSKGSSKGFFIIN